jgi:hypothetical protein
MYLENGKRERLVIVNKYGSKKNSVILESLSLNRPAV